jgi:hypothetical protein
MDSRARSVHEGDQIPVALDLSSGSWDALSVVQPPFRLELRQDELRSTFGEIFPSVPHSRLRPTGTSSCSR